MKNKNHYNLLKWAGKRGLRRILAIRNAVCASTKHPETIHKSLSCTERSRNEIIMKMKNL